MQLTTAVLSSHQPYSYHYLNNNSSTEALPYSSSGGNDSSEMIISIESQNGNECPETEPVDHIRLLTVLIGAPFGVLGVFTNGILVFLFRKSRYRNSPTLYLTILAMLDVLMCLMYVLIFPVDALAIYYRIEWLWLAWHKYSMALYAAGRILHLASTFLVVCATLERFLISWQIKQIKIPNLRLLRKASCSGGRRQSERIFHYSTFSIQFLYSVRGRQMVILIVFILAILFRVWSYFEYAVIRTQCTEPFHTLTFHPNFVQNYAYRAVYNFYIVNLIQVFIPFIVLLFLNNFILIKMRLNFYQEKRRRSSNRNNNNNNNSSSSRRKHLTAPSSFGNNNSIKGTLTTEFTAINSASAHLAAPIGHENFIPLNERQENYDRREENSSCTDNGSSVNSGDTAGIPRSPTSMAWRRRLVVQETKTRLKGVTYTIMAMVTSYLVCGSFDLAIKILEHVAEGKLNSSEAWREFHRLSTDIISILFTVNSFLRLPIYLLCNRTVRNDFANLFCSIQTVQHHPRRRRQQQYEPKPIRKANIHLRMLTSSTSSHNVESHRQALSPFDHSKRGHEQKSKKSATIRPKTSTSTKSCSFNRIRGRFAITQLGCNNNNTNNNGDDGPVQYNNLSESMTTTTNSIHNSTKNSTEQHENDLLPTVAVKDEGKPRFIRSVTFADEDEDNVEDLLEENGRTANFETQMLPNETQMVPKDDNNDLDHPRRK